MVNLWFYIEQTDLESHLVSMVANGISTLQQSLHYQKQIDTKYYFGFYLIILVVKCHHLLHLLHVLKTWLWSFYCWAIIITRVKMPCVYF